MTKLFKKIRKRKRTKKSQRRRERKARYFEDITWLLKIAKAYGEVLWRMVMSKR